MPSKNPLFARKSLGDLVTEAEHGGGLKRSLGRWALTGMGIGAIIGTGIFVLTGVGARNLAGPGLILSYVLAGLACAFAALCYAEFAAMAPVAGSAYTYGYCTLGELVAWIIGWDLILEYAMGAATVANGWAAYFGKFLGLFGLSVPAWLAIDPFTAAEQHRDHATAEALVVRSAEATFTDAQAVRNLSGKDGVANAALPIDAKFGITRCTKVLPVFTEASLAKLGVTATTDEKGKTTYAAEDPQLAASVGRVADALAGSLQYDVSAPLAGKLSGVAGDNAKGAEAYDKTPLKIGGVHFTFNVFAIMISAIIGTILVRGIKESAFFNTLMVVVKLAAVLFVIFAGVGYVDAANWTPFLPYGLSGVLTGAGVIFFAYIGFDAVSTQSEEAKNPEKDIPFGIIMSLLVCTVLYIAVCAVITGMVPYPQIALNAPIAAAFEAKGKPFAAGIITIGALAGMSSVLLVMMLGQPRILMAMARDGLLPEKFFADIHPKYQTPWKGTILTAIFAGLAAAFFPIDALGHMVSIGTLFAFVVVCAAVWLLRRSDPDIRRPFRAPAISFIAPAGIVCCLAMMLSLGLVTWIRLAVWLGIGMVIYLAYGVRHSKVRARLRAAEGASA